MTQEKSLEPQLVQPELNIENEVTDELPVFVGDLTQFAVSLAERIEQGELQDYQLGYSSDKGKVVGFITPGEGEKRNYVWIQLDIDSGNASSVRFRTEIESLGDPAGPLSKIYEDNTYNFETVENVMHLKASILDTPYYVGTDKRPDSVNRMDEVEDLARLKQLMQDKDSVDAYIKGLEDRKNYIEAQTKDGSKPQGLGQKFGKKVRSVLNR